MTELHNSNNEDRVADCSMQRIYGDRKILENPYAHIEDIETRIAAHTMQSIHSARRKLEDPYAYLEDIDPIGFSDQRHVESIRPYRPTNEAYRLKNDDIERSVARLHRAIWTQRSALWNGNPPSDPIELLDPRKAAQLIEYEFHEESAGRYSSPKGSFVVAGLTDTKNRRIVVTPDCPTNQRRFTGAHELGHASLHSGRGVSIHRDKPIDHLRPLRTPEEWEADRFATYFLMPERLVRSEFKKRFLTDPFELTQDSAFGLSGVDGARLVRELTSRRKISRYLVQATSFNGNYFNSMAVYFRVSVEAMAIRLEELDLILTVVA